MNLQSIVLLVLVAALAFYAFRSAFRKGNGDKCRCTSGGCSSCPHRGGGCREPK